MVASSSSSRAKETKFYARGLEKVSAASGVNLTAFAQEPVKDVACSCPRSRMRARTRRHHEHRKASAPAAPAAGVATPTRSNSTSAVEASAVPRRTRSRDWHLDTPNSSIDA